LWQYALLRMLEDMLRLDTRDVSALLRFVSELENVDDPLAFPPRVLADLRRLIPAHEVGYSELNPAERTSILQVWFVEGDEDVGPGSELDAANTLWWRLRPTHPVCGYRATSSDWTQPLKVSDFATLREFRRTPIYDAYYRDELDYWLDVGLPATATKTRVFILTRRGGRDFTERDRLVLELLRPHLEARAAAAESAARAVASLTRAQESASKEAQSIVLCSARGTIEFASPTSRALIARFLGVENGRLPTALLDRPTIVLEHPSERLTIRTAKVGELRVLLLDRRDTRIDLLTPREREIVDRVARGQPNAQIAVEFGIATATVAKHLEHAYRKLGVSTRTAAAALVSTASVESGSGL
jgi:DNA-binding CsgD family transcriptional regulator